MRLLQLLGLCVCVCLSGLTSGCASIGEGANQSTAHNAVAQTRLVNMSCEFRRDGVDSPIRRVAL